MIRSGLIPGLLATPTVPETRSRPSPAHVPGRAGTAGQIGAAVGACRHVDTLSDGALVQAFAAIIRRGNDALDPPPQTHPVGRQVEMTFDAGGGATQ